MSSLDLDLDLIKGPYPIFCTFLFHLDNIILWAFLFHLSSSVSFGSYQTLSFPPSPVSPFLHRSNSTLEGHSGLSTNYKLGVPPPPRHPPPPPLCPVPNRWQLKHQLIHSQQEHGKRSWSRLYFVFLWTLKSKTYFYIFDLHLSGLFGDTYTYFVHFDETNSLLFCPV